MSTAHTVRSNEKIFSQKLKNGLNGSDFNCNKNAQYTSKKALNKIDLESTKKQNGTVYLEDQFKAACDTIQNLPKNGPFQPSNDMLLKFYAYFKQATVGPCKSSRPAIYKVVERAKHDSWNSVKHLNKEEAMQGYIDEIKKIVETMPHNEFVQKLIDIIGPFYEYVNDENTGEEDDEESENDDESDKQSVVENQEYTKKNLHLNNILTTSFENIDKSMLNSFNENSLNSLSNQLKQINGSSSTQLNGVVNHNGNCTITNGMNGHENKLILINLKKSSDSLNDTFSSENIKANFLNGNSNYSNNDLNSDEEEDFCDTSDHLIEQEIFTQKIKKNINLQTNGDISRDHNHNHVLNKINEDKVPPRREDTSASSCLNQSLNNDAEVKNILKEEELSTGKNHTGNTQQPVIIHKYGGELNSPPSSLPFSSNLNQQSRQSRPGSSQSIGYGLSRGAQNTGNGSGGAGGSGGNENFIAQDTNRQILLILLRLQQDTNNVLTRLSYLESSVLTLQNNLQMNRLESSIQMNNQNPSAFSLVNSPQSRSVSTRSSTIWFLRDLFKNIDWKTVIIAIVWPFIIRLVFFFLKKVKLVIKFRRIKN